MAVFLPASKIWTHGCFYRGAGTGTAVTVRSSAVSLNGYGTRLIARLKQNLFCGLTGTANVARANNYLCPHSGGPRCTTTQQGASLSLKHSAAAAATAAGTGRASQLVITSRRQAAAGLTNSGRAVAPDTCMRAAAGGLKGLGSMQYSGVAGAAGTNAGLGLVLGALTMGLGFGAMLMLTSMRGTREKVARSLNNVKHSLHSMRTCGAHTDTLKGVTSHNKFMTGSRLAFVLLICAIAQGGGRPPQRDFLPTARRILTAGGGLGGREPPPANTTAKIPPDFPDFRRNLMYHIGKFIKGQKTLPSVY